MRTGHVFYRALVYGWFCYEWSHNTCTIRDLIRGEPERALNTRVTYGEFAVPMYVCIYVCIYVCSDTSSTCLSRMRKYSDGKDRHDAVLKCGVGISMCTCIYD